MMTPGEFSTSHPPSGVPMTTSSSDQPLPPQQFPQPQQQQQQQQPERPPIPLTAALLLEKLAPSRDDDPDNTEPSPDTVSSSSYSRVDIESSQYQRGSTAIDDDNDDDENHSTTSATSSSIDRPPGCTICLEAFQVGDNVSWSTDPTCGHVFHHSCIREWLLRRVACPCCRTVLLPVDRPYVSPTTTIPSPTAATRTIQRGQAENIASASSSATRRSVSHRKAAPTKKRLTPQIMEIYAEERARRTITSYYCVQDGLVILDAFGLTHREPTITSSLLLELLLRLLALLPPILPHGWRVYCLEC
jgi:Ring finger domain